ncbi:cell surface glycoprotein MUC18 [Hemiscyllium ocellatum]|uniref:cell surface glycoprotein MUC18 n=1 Tax=Hemiscyllium ocellatum TaxID=170820 RepID=UPI00296607EF|nr:cell surface glycoprotein MUC18 [Hemiscyllium ocellatum]
MDLLYSTCLLVCICLPAIANAKLQVSIKEPSGPIVEGSDVILQCLDEGQDMSHVRFQMYHKWLRSWFNIDTTTSFRCWYYSFNVSRDNGELLLRVKQMYKWHAGPYRCVSNGTDGQLISKNITVPLQYLNSISISEPGSVFSRYMRDPRVVRVMRGKDVEVKCCASSSEPPMYQWKRKGNEWIYPNSSLKIVKITLEQGGVYTCTATHPSLPSLTQSKSVLIEVVEEPLSSLQLSDMNLILAIAIPAGVLFLVIIGIITYKCKAKRNEKGMMLLDNQVSKTPIWKGSDSSIPYCVTDSVPLVM